MLFRSASTTACTWSTAAAIESPGKSRPLRVEPHSRYNQSAMKVSVIIPAAGLGTRMGRESRKQFLELDGSPILVHTLRKFQACPSVSEIVLAVRPEDMDSAREMVAEVKQTKPIRFVQGGETRQESVENGLASLGADVDLVEIGRAHV